MNFGLIKLGFLLVLFGNFVNSIAIWISFSDKWMVILLNLSFILIFAITATSIDGTNASSRKENQEHDHSRSR